MSKILVTGHRGWIGSNFTRLLDNNGISWVGIDQKDGDTLGPDMSIFLDRVKDCDTVVHLAATPRIPPSWDSPDHYRDNNVGVTDMVARICTEQEKYLVFASSSSIYGDGAGPLNPYSWSKFAGEESIRMYGRSRGLKYTIARIFTNYGEDDPSGLVIGRWIAAHQAGQPVLLRGDGSQSRDFIHVSDTAAALLAICQQRPDQQRLDIGTGVNVHLLDIVEKFGFKYTSELELVGYAQDTRADIYHTIARLKWKPKINLLDWIGQQLSK